MSRSMAVSQVTWAKLSMIRDLLLGVGNLSGPAPVLCNDDIFS